MHRATAEVDVRDDERAPWAIPAARLWHGGLVMGVVGWWALMGLVPASRAHFLPAAMGDASLWAFLVPDVLLVALPSLVAWSRLPDRPEEARWTSWFVLGGLAYSAVWSLAASLWTWQAPLGPMVMLPVAFVHAVLSWTLQPRTRWFREATEATTAARLLKTVADAVLFTGVFLFVAAILIRLFEDTYHVPRAAGLPWAPTFAVVGAMNLGGLVSGSWLVFHGDGTPLPVDTARRLVVVGPYRWVRNPMAALGIYQGFVLALGLGSWLTALYVLFGATLWHGFVRPIEERDLRERFGPAYEAYCAEVSLWVPVPPSWRRARR